MSRASDMEQVELESNREKSQGRWIILIQSAGSLEDLILHKINLKASDQTMQYPSQGNGVIPDVGAQKSRGFLNFLCC